MSELKIESGIKIPRRKYGDQKWVDLAEKMEVGQSVRVGSISERNMLGRRLKQQGRGYTSRTMDGVLVVWRTS